ncbi:delta-60 repeat domain-containing protein [Nocardioides sp. SLBN-35]|uniref:delta-60 repeat domain-containing protein n=1 Tax=Nocardioides sp. SLBN-35 TaxID=2768445 RepID=UPI0011737CFD|nr:delta-60 repeat domain-containing protein [Nocardioides sp. SLBN-35]TQK71258.1 fibrinogen beta/gamma subunit family protein [Nocardioides sp. SLBN-35]
MPNLRVPVALLSSLALGAGLVTLGAPTPARAAVASQTIPAAQLGTAPDTAAGSCWEIKQQRPSAPNGAYWLVTPAMSEPLQVYCDQTTDGGGWVLVGKGRNGWTTDYDGRDADTGLLDPGYAGGADAHQLSSATIDQLLDGGRVDALADGIRLRRAAKSDGSSWQETRFKLASRDRWVWTFDARHPLSSSTIAGTTRTGGITTSFGSDSTWKWVDTRSREVTGWSYGFSYGTKAIGSSSDSSYLYSPTNGGSALPVTQVYLRPRVTSTGFTAIPDGGTTALEQRAQASSLADSLTWGVTGMASTPSAEGDVEVQAFTQSGDRMFVAGNFRYVTSDDGSQWEQPYLAAFDVATGAWISSFRPTFDQQVRTLATLPDGRIVAGGLFSQVNGQSASAIVALDPRTGATSTGFSTQIENRITGGVTSVRSLAVVGDDLVIGGSFTHVKNAAQSGWSYMRNLARVRVSDGSAWSGWNPELNGTVASVAGSDDDAQVYAVGFFSQARGAIAAKRAAAVMMAGDGALATPAWNPTWSNTNDYQRTVATGPGQVWVGGSEHSMFGFSPATFARKRTTIFDPHGDLQALARDGDVMYAGCHCNANTYTDAVTWPLDSTPWSQADAIHWAGAFDASTGERIPGFTPTFKSRIGSGIWAITTDTNGRVWMGGDIVTASSARSAKDPSGGFARFSPRDVSAPSRPGDLRVVSQTGSAVTLGWNASSDAGKVHYQVLRGDRPVATTTATSITLPFDGTARYFVRAADAAGNVSASTPVLTVARVSELVATDATWSWWYQSTPPADTWAQPAYDDSAWPTGSAVLGWGTASIATPIDTFPTTKDRPLTAYFRRTVEVAEPAQLSSLKLTVLANDGAAVYVNGVEVARKGLPAGPLTSTTYASAAIRDAAAQADPLVVEVPLALLRPGANEIAVETHLNYRATPDVTFRLQALATSAG